MSKTATLEIEGKKYEFPIFIGSENEMSIDISKLRDLSGAITLDPGYKNTGSCKSEITFLDGEEGVLHYRGYSIEELAEKKGIEYRPFTCFLDLGLVRSTIGNRVFAAMKGAVDGGLNIPHSDKIFPVFKKEVKGTNALKERIYENLMQAGENTMQLMQYMNMKLREARNKAVSFVNTPDFGEFKKLWETNRKAQYGKYYDMFKTSMPYHPYYT